MAPSLTTLQETGLPNTNPPPSIKLEASTFLANIHPILTQVPTNIFTTPLPPHDSSNSKNNAGCFVGFDAGEPRSRHVVPLGKLKGIKFMSIFRFKLWWSTQWTGTNGSQVEHETQIMMLENNGELYNYWLLCYRKLICSGIRNSSDSQLISFKSLALVCYKHLMHCEI